LEPPPPERRPEPLPPDRLDADRVDFARLEPERDPLAVLFRDEPDFEPDEPDFEPDELDFERDELDRELEALVRARDEELRERPLDELLAPLDARRERLEERREPPFRSAAGISSRATAFASCAICFSRNLAIRSSSRRMPRASFAVSLSPTVSASDSIPV